MAVAATSPMRGTVWSLAQRQRRRRVNLDRRRPPTTAAHENQRLQTAVNPLRELVTAREREGRKSYLFGDFVNQPLDYLLILEKSLLSLI